MELTAQKKLASHICRLIKVTDIIFPIGRTPKGNLGIRFSANSDDFDIMLDSIPLSTKDMLQDENNIELKRMLEKYWFEPISVKTVSEITREFLEPTPKEAVDSILKDLPKKQRGRPKGSKAKVK